MIEEDYGVRHIFFESLSRESAAAAFSRYDGGQSLVLQPAEQSAQLCTQHAGIRQAGEQGLDRIQHNALRADRAHGVLEPDKQSFEVVCAGLFDLAPLDANVVDDNLARFNEAG